MVDEPSPRRVHRRRTHGAPVLMVIAGAVGLVLTLTALDSGAPRQRIAVAATDLVPGATLRVSSVRFEAVAASDGILERFVRPSDLRTRRGEVVTEPVRAGEPLLSSGLRPPAATDGRRAMSIPVARARAVNGKLSPGDRVDVVVAGDREVAIVVAGAEVLDVDDGGRGGLGARPGEVSVTLAVDTRESQLLAAALVGGDFVLTRVTGATTAAGAAPLDTSRGSR